MVQTSNGHVFRALTVAGSDSGGGAGIQADLKTMHQFQVYGMSVVTAITAQNTIGVQGIHEVSPVFVRQQLESVFDDIGVDAVKTGMLANTEITLTVAKFLKEVHARNLVVDPVMIAKGGSALLKDDAVQSLVSSLLPLAQVVTPNLPEAEILCGYSINTWEDCHKAASDIAALGARAVVIKGGHMPLQWIFGQIHQNELSNNVAVDLVYAEGRFTYFATERVHSQKTHGTGCTYSAALTSMLAQNESLLTSIASAKAFVFQTITSAAQWDVGSGHGPTDHSVSTPLPFFPKPGLFYIFHEGKWVSLT